MAGDAPGTVAKGFGGAAGVAASGLGDVYSALSAVSGATQVGLIGWLRVSVAFDPSCRGKHSSANAWMKLITLLAVLLVATDLAGDRRYRLVFGLT